MRKVLLALMIGRWEVEKDRHRQFRNIRSASEDVEKLPMAGRKLRWICDEFRRKGVSGQKSGEYYFL